MKTVLLHNATIHTPDESFKGSITIVGDRIGAIERENEENCAETIQKNFIRQYPHSQVKNLEGLHIIAGGIDPHVHFRDPGLTHKADFESESRAAALGGVTSIMDMPNTKPATVSLAALSDKIASAKGRSHVNFGFHLGATNENFPEIEKCLQDHRNMIAGIKVFMGSSTGNMLVDNQQQLEKLFALKGIPILVHCEDEATIRENLQKAREKFGEQIPFGEHPNIRSRSACIRSSAKALDLAVKFGTRLHLCHISTAEEVKMVRCAKRLNPLISAETSINYLWFDESLYPKMGSLLKCNPAVKGAEDRRALVEALKDGTIDVIGTDHAPHLLSEKSGNYLTAPSGLPSIQHSLEVLVSLAQRNDIPLTRIAAAFSANAAKIFSLKERGCIKEGYKADLAVFSTMEHIVKEEEIAGKCGWSPYVGEKLDCKVVATYIGGMEFNPKETPKGEALAFGE